MVGCGVVWWNTDAIGSAAFIAMYAIPITSEYLVEHLRYTAAPTALSSLRKVEPFLHRQRAVRTQFYFLTIGQFIRNWRILGTRVREAG